MGLLRHGQEQRGLAQGPERGQAGFRSAVSILPVTHNHTVSKGRETMQVRQSFKKIELFMYFCAPPFLQSPKVVKIKGSLNFDLVEVTTCRINPFLLAGLQSYITEDS